MLKVGITGGIGSGKSTVCRVFKTLGIPVFDADAAAKYLMETDKELIAQIKGIFGEHIYNNNKLDRPQLASVVFSQPEKLKQLNEIVHPATVVYGKLWHQKQTSPYTLKEAAIFFESDTYKEMDLMIGVYAPIELRIKRAMERGNVRRAEIQARIDRQMDEETKMNRCNYVIINDGKTAVLPQVIKVDYTIRNIINQ